ncbi:helix-turn-helix transcriptional regulator [Clostridium sp. YIM B02505]|uniref:Helix-turn-helix transcriptional regulator n=1 Tax=Clostridium yunnanense TaxID=2800325 RepID=A0ABS1EVL2_9CLOT|nr:helix-turn-helix transcriptional regulator [Clostridium yunnanense]MBK1813388.1 helix-turn-helix transcriptional regulator [Clostridium yunnanense]
MNFYKPNEKIKFMRKNLHMSQADLENTNMTRAFISMMESGRRNVTKTSSKLLYEKFSERAKALGIELNIDEDYFSTLPQEDAKAFCEKELKKDISHQYIEYLIAIAVRFDLDDILAEAYKKDGDKYYREGNYNNAFMSFTNALGKLKELKNFKEQLFIYNCLGVCKSEISEHKDAVFYFQECINYSVQQQDYYHYIKASFNLARAYSYLQRYEECLKLINENILESNLHVDEQYKINAMIIRANALYSLDKQEEALSEYYSIIDEVGDENELVLSIVYTNLGEHYYKVDQLDKSLKYTNEAQRLKNKVNKRSLSVVLNTKGKILFKQGLLDESALVLELAVSKAKEYGNYDSLLENLKDLIKVYEKMNDIDKMKELSMELINLHENKNITLI